MSQNSGDLPGSRANIRALEGMATELSNLARAKLKTMNGGRLLYTESKEEREERDERIAYLCRRIARAR